MAMGLVVAMMATAACTKKDNSERGHAGVGPNYGQQGPYQNGNQNGNQSGTGFGWNQNLPGDFEVRKLSTRGTGAGAQAILTIPGYPISVRGNFEKIRIGCADSTRTNFQSSNESITMIDGAELAVIGDLSRDKQNTLVICNDGNIRDDRFRQGGRRFEKITANTLRVGQYRDVTLTPARRSHQERIVVRITCSTDLVTQMAAGINLSRGSTILVNQEVRNFGRFQNRFQGSGQPPWNSGVGGRIERDEYPTTRFGNNDRSMSISCD